MITGIAIKDLYTPALLVDLDIMESNLQKMAVFFQDKSCKLRPHFKNIKCISLAKRQIAAGAIGITTATLPETETLVNAGINSILIANEIAGEANIKKLIELSYNTEIILAVDNKLVINEIARLSNGNNNKLKLVADIDVGLKRCGVQFGLATLELVKAIIGKGLKFEGLMGYEGHLQRLEPGKKAAKLCKEALHQLIVTRNMLRDSGIPVNIISAGGTGTYAVAGSTEGITEVQAGNYLLMDSSYAPYAPDFQPALNLLTTVISVTPGERFILNAGIKEISAERGLPSLKWCRGATLKELHAEHAIVELAKGAEEVNVGDTIELNVYYSDGTVNLHREMFGVRNGIVEEIFPLG